MMDVPYNRSSQSEAEQKKCSIAHLPEKIDLQAICVNRVEARFCDSSALTWAKSSSSTGTYM